jgi:uncharacterized protein YlzI (FlbEa/FlbD family)
MINYFKINDTDSIDLYKVELIRVMPDRLCIFSHGREYYVEERYAQEFLDTMKMIESGGALTNQYVAV